MTEVNADFSRPARMRSSAMPWQRSPAPGVWRKRLELVGEAERGRVTSLVRYAPDSRFPPHPHPEGEEILVLEGTFADENGTYPAGTFLLNPEGYRHAPRSEEGCVLFVKLRQYPGRDRRRIVVDSRAETWSPAAGGLEELRLYEEPDHEERIRLVRLAAGARLAAPATGTSVELLVISGDLREGDEQFEDWAWLRYPRGISPDLRTDTGCTLYVKTGHL